MKNPRIYEIHTAAWLDGLSARHARTISLAHVPDAEIDRVADLGVDVVWLMGVWERSPAGRRVALAHPGLAKDYARALPSYVPDDITGSPYAIRRYSVDPSFGGPDGLAKLRERLAARGMRLLLDFVPNHVALDHPWTSDSPSCLLSASEEDLARAPEAFFRGPLGHVFAHGKDPYFPAWTDTAQVDAASPALRAAAARSLLDIALQCDGVRCDMAMLVTNDVFSRTWGALSPRAPAAEYWPTVLAPVKRAHPSFLLVAEVYWDMEWQILQQGFDFAYDKRLYDRMRHETAASIRAHLGADPAHQSRLVRFIENHDEPRAMAEFGPSRVAAAATLALTLPGARLVHEGQESGHRVKLPVQLRRRPVEEDIPSLRDLHRTLLAQAGSPVLREGELRLRHAAPAPWAPGEHTSLLSYTYRLQDERRLVVVNWSDRLAQGFVPLSDVDLAGRTWHLRDLLDGALHERDGDAMSNPGLHVVLGPWRAHLFSFTPAG